MKLFEKKKDETKQEPEKKSEVLDVINAMKSTNSEVKLPEPPLPDKFNFTEEQLLEKLEEIKRKKEEDAKKQEVKYQLVVCESCGHVSAKIVTL